MNRILAIYAFVCTLVILGYPLVHADAPNSDTIPVATSSMGYLPLVSNVAPTITPTSTPVSLRFPVATVASCVPQPHGNWFEGTVYVRHQPANGYRVVFSDSPDGAWRTDPSISGPHCPYNWPDGYYSHIIHAAGPQADDWYVWIVNENKQRISEIAHWRSTGPGDGCNQAVVNFDTE